MASEMQYSPRQRELFIQKSTRVAASYLRRARAWGTRRRTCGLSSMYWGESSWICRMCRNRLG